MPYLRPYRPVISVLFVGFAAAGLAACDVVINSMDGEFGGGRFKAEQSYAKTFTVNAQGATLELVNTNGKIEVEAVDGTAIDVKATITAKGATDEAAREALKQVEVKEDATPTRVRIEAKHPNRRQSIEVRYTVRVPRGVKIDVRNTNGAVDMTGLGGGVRAETTNGSVKGRGLTCAVDASTTNGGIDIQLAALVPEGIRLETTNGGITLGLPPEAKATLTARCVHGSVSVTDLKFERDRESSGRRVDGKINGGGAPLTVETVNGGVRIRPTERSAPAAVGTGKRSS